MIRAVATPFLVPAGDVAPPSADRPAVAAVHLAAGLLGAAIAVAGLTLDTVLLGAYGLGHPKVGEGRADAIAVGLLAGHAGAVPGAAGAGWWRHRSAGGVPA